MVRRVPWTWALLLAAPGCLPSEQNLSMVTPGAQTSTSFSLPHDPLKMKAPATEAEAKRVVLVGQKILAANPHQNPRPMIVTVGVEQEEIFHQGSGSVYSTEGLARQCKTEAQLAAVLCMELGRMAVEQERLAGPGMGPGGGQAPPDMPVGDYREMFGGPDRTRQMELYKYDRARRPSTTSTAGPSADTLARGLLQKAGYASTELDNVAALLSKAEQHVALEQQFTGK